MRYPTIASIAFFLLLAAGHTMSSAQVSPPESREAVLAKAERLQATSATETASMDRFTNATDPFHLAEGGESPTELSPVAAVPKAPPRSDKEILADISELLRPTGVLEFGQKTLLVIGERRVPVGQHFLIKLKGETYKVQIVKATAKGFMLQLNDETISKRIQ